MRSFLIAVQFLTCIPIRLSGYSCESEVRRSLNYYPLVGLVIGLLLCAMFWALNETPDILTAALILAAWVLLTGGLHLDGFADSADAWVGGLGDKEKTLAIMKDPRCGFAAVTAIVLILIINFSAIHVVVTNGEWEVLLLAPILGRTILPLLFLTTPYMRSQGLGAAFSNHDSWVTVCVLLATMLIIIVSETAVVWIVVTVTLVFSLLRKAMLSRIGGCTGDTAGALVVITETTALLVGLLVIP